MSDQGHQTADSEEVFRPARGRVQDHQIEAISELSRVLACADIPRKLLFDPVAPVVLAELGFDPARKHPRRPAPQIRGSVAEKMSALEKKVERQERAIRELRLRLDSGSSQERLDDIVKRMENAFGDLERVVRVSYDILRDGRWRVVVVHAMDDRGSALMAICDKSLEIQDAFGGVEIVPLVLHEDEVRDEHLAGTSLVFSRTGA